MITRVFEITDTYTEEYCLVIQFEEIDKELCKRLKITPGFKIVNRIDGRKVESFAGYNFDPESHYENIECQSNKLHVDGTIQSFGILLSGINDIKSLPEQIDLENIRLNWRDIDNNFIDENILEIIEENDKDDLRKILYHFIQYHTAILNIRTKEVLIDIGTTSDLERLIAEYLWIPIKNISKEELNEIKISPFKIDVILPEEL